ncbi:MAG: bi-domain-containing oxidoreductase [Chromatiales bacterium]|nr:bi-domain-containing oxidoreductase [Chromatiales bacterium]
MKQILQSLRDGATTIETVPVPLAQSGRVVIRSRRSLISAGTERMLLEFGKANFIDKARQQPDKVRQVLDKIRTDGIGPTMRSVQAKLDKPIPLGYSNAGVVVEVGAGVTRFSAGDRVVSNGSHAEYVCVPENLCAKIPDGVSDEAASFTVVSAIALQGIRLVQPTLGEVVVVTGLGLIGLLAVQLLRANGCQVLGIDLDPRRAELARRFGAMTCVPSAGEDPLAAARRASAGRGVDAVVITASTDSNEPVHQAAQMCRKRGRIVLVGVTGLQLSRADFYEKELTFQVSCSYGPGRYDPAYEEQGHDYPVGFVRWTEQRNFEAVLDLMASGALDVSGLVSERVDIADATRGYELLAKGGPIAIVLQYPEAAAPPGLADRVVALPPPAKPRPAAAAGAPRVSVIGAGNYAAQVLIPGLAATPARLQMLVSAGGVSGVRAGRKHGFATAGTDAAAALADTDTDAVVIATRHDNHADLVEAALRNRKHVFVEKPLAITRAQLAQVEAAHAEAVRSGFAPVVMTGFNRRFAPQVVKMRELLKPVAEPKVLVMTVNAGEIPPDHWTQSDAVGGGRIIGEGCHFVDLLRFLVGQPIRRTRATMVGEAPGVPVREDKSVLTLEFADGSLGTVHYVASGHRSFPKERLEVFCGGAVLQLDNFRKLTGFGWPGFGKLNLWKQDKGNEACIAAFVAAVAAGQPSPMPFDEQVEVTRATFDAVEAMRAGS